MLDTILEEEELLITAHRMHIEETMELVRAYIACGLACRHATPACLHTPPTCTARTAHTPACTARMPA
eukprot:347417-Chlamydomonas_euryale.AAC.2